MSYTLKKTQSLESLRHFIVGVEAGLAAQEDLIDLSLPWREVKVQVAAARDARDADQDAEIATTFVVRVRDAQWDGTVKGAARKSLFLSGGDADKPPYSALFGTVKATSLTRLGPAKARVAGAELVAKLRALGNPELMPFADELEARNLALAAAEEADAAAEARVLTHAVARAQLLRKVETLIAETEAKILSRHPGDDELVKAILSPSNGAPRREPARADDPAADPE